MSIRSRGPAHSTVLPKELRATQRQAPVSLETVRPLLRGLNREQRRAVTHGEGPLLVVAGPGTGKTEVITRRIAWLIATKRARPGEILALTFTDKAADEMQGRVDMLVPYGRADAAIHTFHAFGDRLLREFGFELGRTNAPRVIRRAEAVVLLREHLFELGLDRYLPLADPTRFLSALTDLISRAKDEGVSAEEYLAFAAELRAGAEAVLVAAAAPGAREIGEALVQEAAGHAELAAAYERYGQLMVERGLVDFGDQVTLALRLLEDRPAVRAEIHRRYRYLLVDEFQDTNPVQLALVRAIAGERSNVTVVGDDDQAIYTFRGAAVENILGFGASFPALRRVVLRRNYRSRAPILAAAHRLIRHNEPHRLDRRDGVDKTLVPHRRAPRPLPVRYVGYRNASEEADGVATTIARRVASGDAPSDFAILVRTNADAEGFLRSLDHQGVPWRFSGASGLYARREVRDLLAFLRVAANPDSSIDLYAVASGDPYRLGGEGLTALLEAGRRRHRSLWSICTELLEQPGLLRLDRTSRAALERLVTDIRDAVSASHTMPAGDVLYRHLKQNGRLATLIASAERGDDVALRNVARFFEILRAQAPLLAEDRLPFLVPHLGTLVEAGDDPADADVNEVRDAVSVLTIHKAKGLEFPIVFLVGLAEGRFPIRGRKDRLPLPDALRRTPLAEEEVPWSEERRLCYVAMTRARDELVLSSASESNGGRRRRTSPFVAESLDRLQVLSREDASSALTVAGLVAALEPPAPVPASDLGADTSTASDRPLSLSYSQLDDYLSCPLRYRLRHVVRVPTPAHHALVLGNALHQAVAAFHLTRMRGRTMAEAELLDVFATHWSSEGFLSREHEEARFASGQAALRRFLQEQLRDGALDPVAVERPFSVRLGRDTVRGRYDRLDETPDGTVITDYKSSDVRDPKKATEKARDSLQLQLYALAHQAETGELPAAVELHFLESGVTGRVTPDPARLEKTRKTLEAAAEGIRAGRFEARPDYFSCGYCPFRDICPSSAA
jgi:DNA helicase II / ATP-dependent DNA helicase PcrA